MTLRPTIAITLAAATALLAVTACRKDETAAKTQGKVVARVGSREITSAEMRHCCRRGFDIFLVSLRVGHFDVHDYVSGHASSIGDQRYAIGDTRKALF